MYTNRPMILSGALALSIALSGCGGGSSSAPSATATATAAQSAPALSIPPKIEGEVLKVVVDPGSLAPGEQVHVSVYGGGFSDVKECVREVAGQDVQVTNKPVELRIPLPGPGNYRAALSAPGFVTDCQQKAAAVTALSVLDVNVNFKGQTQEEQTAEVGAGKPLDVSVMLKGKLPKKRPITVELRTFGPFNSEAELRAAGCNPENLFQTQNVQWKGGQNKSGESETQAVKHTIKSPGLYLIQAHALESMQSAKASTECGEYRSELKVNVLPEALTPAPKKTAAKPAPKSTQSTAKPKPSPSR